MAVYGERHMRADPREVSVCGACVGPGVVHSRQGPMQEQFAVYIVL